MPEGFYNFLCGYGYRFLNEEEAIDYKRRLIYLGGKRRLIFRLAGKEDLFDEICRKFAMGFICNLQEYMMYSDEIRDNEGFSKFYKAWDETDDEDEIEEYPQLEITRGVYGKCLKTSHCTSCHCPLCDFAVFRWELT